MHRLLTMKRLSVLFLSAFAVLMGGVFAYEALVTAPGDRCEAQGKWWDASSRVCAQPIAIAELTGRPNGVSRKDASMAKLQELVEIERGLAAAKAARDADADRQRAALAAER
jgi:hypothetical protein